ncbi:MAG: OmpA family protein [Acidobacteria bacterium]|nr:OmpA family protein [Acidobacteriota bacterium]
MTHRSPCFRSPSTRRTLLAAVVLALLPLATAAAQELPRVRVTRAETLYAMRYSHNDVWRLTRVEPGSVYEFIAVDGDGGKHLESNHYLLLLPRDAFGTQWLGWISGENVEPAPPRPPVAAATPGPMSAAAAAPPPVAAPAPATPGPAPMPTMAVAPRSLPDVVLRFAFDRSDLSEAAKETLTTALKTMSAEGGNLSFALGGHADATGTDVYNQKLGLARADAVRKYLAEQLQVPADRIAVSSHGESQPVAPNTTRAGRAENRRVVVTVTAVAPAMAGVR